MTDSGENIRAFLAIVPPENILQELSRMQETLKREISGRISWIKLQSQHLTLKFFGDITKADVNNICASVSRRTASEPSLNLKIESLGVFPDVRKPRVLWCGVTGDGEKLSALQKQLEVDFEGIGFPRENLQFQSHLTLGRIRESHGINGITEALNKHKSFTAGIFECRQLILFQSMLSPQGAVYTKLAEFIFKG
jgi:2'-5' RNA ligase